MMTSPPRQRLRRRSREQHDPARSTIWQPPTGWLLDTSIAELAPEYQTGNYVPPGWRPTEHELPTPAPPKTVADAVEEWNRCRNSLVYFALHYLWSLHVDDPDYPQWRKMPAYPHVIRMLTELQTAQHQHWDKSRQMLGSWCVMAAFLWDILFHDDWADLAVSKRAKEVDDGGENSTHDSLLGKLRLMHARLPAHLWTPFDIKAYLVRNPKTRSHVKGETGNTEAGRSGNYKRALCDEFAYTKHGETVLRAVLSAAKKGTYLLSTPNGKDNAFYRVKASKTTAFKKGTLHWTQHPVYSDGMYCRCGFKAQPGRGLPIDQFNAHLGDCPLLLAGEDVRPRSPAYDIAAATLTPWALATEWDVSYERSLRGRVFEPFTAARHRYDHTRYVGEPLDFETLDAYRERYLRSMLNPKRPTVIGWDFGVNDPNAMSLGQVVDEDTCTIDWIDEEVKADKSWRHHHAFYVGLWLRIWNDVGGRTDIQHYGDPSGKNRDSELKSWILNLENADPPIYVQHYGEQGGPLEWIDFVREKQRRGHFYVSSFATQMVDMLEQWTFPLDKNGDPIPGKHLPIHNAHSHIGTSMLYVYRYRWNHRLNDVDHRAVPLSTLLDRPGSDTFDYTAIRERF